MSLTYKGEKIKMIKEAIKYIKDSLIKPDERFVDIKDADGLNRTFVVDQNGLASEIKSSLRISNEPLVINTLTGLVDYIKANLERVAGSFYLHVENQERVTLTGLLKDDGSREELVVAHAITPAFDYSRFHEAEELIIALQSKFVTTNDRDLILKVIGNIKEENVRNTGDNGFSQAVTIKTGITSVGDVVVPNPVNLAPYRTFLEVEQPSSDFIFRMKDGPRGAIFEADGGMWRNKAITNVRDYLAVELKDEIESKRITIIA